MTPPNICAKDRDLRSKKIAFAWVAWLILALLAAVSFVPISMKQYVLSNGQKTIVFQSMIHIASADFYHKIDGEIRAYKNSGYRLVYEGIYSDTPQQRQILSTRTGVSNSDRDGIAFDLGLVRQPEYFHLISENDINADLSAEQLLYLIPPAANTSVDTEHLDDNTNSESREKPNETLGKVSLRQNLRIYKNIFPEDLLSVKLKTIIIDLRNNVLVNTIINGGHDKYFVAYGADHFPGFYKTLTDYDPNWRIIRKRYFEAF